MRTLRLAIVGSLLASPAVASAEQVTAPIDEYVAPVQGWMVSERAGAPGSLRQVLPANDVTSLAGETLILYINKNGVTLSPGDNDARTNRSTLVNQTTAVPAYTIAATAWAQIMSCTRTMWAPYNVQVVDVDPGNVPHMESIVTTLSSTIGLDPNIGGVSPYTIGCTAIPNSIVFTFGQAFNGDPETICEVMGQEMAHSIGLDHQMLASDPMTYLPYNGLQAFRDQTVSCGENANRACGLQNECGATQNSHQMLLARVGPTGGGDPTDAVPTAAITSPSNGASVRPGFTVTVNAADDGTVTRVELYIDGALAGTKTAAPFSFSTALAMGSGAHDLLTVVYDNAGQSSEDQIAVTVSPDAPPGDGDGDGDGTGGGQDPSELVSGCSTGGSGSGLALLGLALLGLIGRRKRS